jgi:iron(III) transport system permease protein
MSFRPRLARRGRALLDDDARGVGLTVLAAAVAAVLVLPVVWLVVDAAGLGVRAIALTVDPRTLQVLLRSVALVAVVTAGSVLIGVALAVLTAQADLPFPRLFTVLSALPLVIPSYLGAFAAVSAFGPHGELADVLAPLGVSQVPTIYGFGGAAAVLTLYTYPYVFLTTRASLLSLDASLLAAARTLDCGRLEAFRRVTLPQILPGVAAGALLVALYTLSDFGTPNLMRVEVFTQFIFAQHNAFARDYAVLLSLHLVAVTALILAVESRIGADDAGAYTNRGNRGGATVSLGAWRYPATVLPIAVTALAIVLPIAIFGTWLVRGGVGYSLAAPEFSWSYGWNSVLLALLAAGASILLALPVAFQSATSGSRLAAFADRVSYVGYAIPGIVVGIALLRSSLEIAPAIHKTLPLLVFAYVVRFVPQAVGSIRASTMQIDRRLTEAARTLGAPPLATFRRVTLPLIAPGIATGGALVFLTTMKELPATLLLAPSDPATPLLAPSDPATPLPAPSGFDTLVTYIWRVKETGAYGQVAVPALVLIGVSALSMAVILAQENT